VTGRSGGGQPFTDDRQRLQLRRRASGGTDQREVGHPGADSPGEGDGIILDQRDRDTWVGLVEAGERFEQAGDAARGDHADDQPAPDQAVHLVDRLPQRGTRGQRGAGMR